MSDKEGFQSWCESKDGAAVSFRYDEQGNVQSVVKRVPIALEAIYAALKDVASPNLPRILSVEKSEDVLLITEEYIPGKSLRQILDEKGHEDDRETLALAKAMCEALSILHFLNPPVIHRDIKPENIICSDSGAYVLIDFDAARQYEKDAGTDTVLLGTHGYAAPEQYGFTQSDVRSDIFSLGATLFEYRMGKPYKKDAACEGILADVIGKCTQFDAVNRYQSVHELKGALDRKERKRKPFCIGAIAVGAVLALGIGVTLALPKDDPVKQEPSPVSTDVPGPSPSVAASMVSDPDAVPCTCTLITRPDDERLGGKTVFEYPGAVYLPMAGDFFGELPITKEIRVEAPRDSSHCKAEEHTEQVWEYSLAEEFSTPDGARVEDGYITVTKPGEYFVEYFMPDFNGMGYGAQFAILVREEMEPAPD